MFSERPDGTLIHYNWPSNYGRVIPDNAAKAAITRRERLGGLLVTSFVISSFFKDSGQELSVLTIVSFSAAIIWFSEWLLFIRKFEKVPLDVTPEEIDQETLKRIPKSYGYFAIVIGLYLLGLLIYGILAAPNFWPWLLLLSFCALAFVYLGVRTLAAKKSNNSFKADK